MRLKEIPRGEERFAEQIIEHYEIEKELACKLKNSTREERKKLYTILYDELYKKVPHHPQLLKKAQAQIQHNANADKLRLLSRFFPPIIYLWN